MLNTDRAAVWQQRLDDHAKSGLSVSKWCASNGCTVKQFQYWRRKLSPKSISPDDGSSPEWVRLALEPDRAPKTCNSLTLKVSGAEIELHHGFDADLLRRVVRALATN
jgi:hypothetical protein